MDDRRPAGLDAALLRAVRIRLAAPALTSGARALSAAGEHGALWIAGGLLAAGADRPRRGRWLRAAAVVAGAHLGSMAVKRVVRRPRPELAGFAPLVRTAGRHSFPSSHAASAAAAAVVYRGLLPRPAVAALGGGAAAMCVSRLVVGVHYPTDVAAGAALGALAAGIGRAWVAGAADRG
ncbi:phosphatase PAP2 family protein [Streptacidiphilus sp. P02-A3a]|uniref:phosphatase PAP2 family protein n=1 Tax=Streptacidiphilus sp. P02-A3a TaxID=2704468 RepID=UPI0015FACF6C|nr:phosphatase PAP2 family protein [Streptacidiphilus sp. P02-A3a]QMU72658.1 phosphatase PAP2 family protein [Streptacidiphilus sp. P02-A3a]